MLTSNLSANSKELAANRQHPATGPGATIEIRAGTGTDRDEDRHNNKDQRGDRDRDGKAQGTARYGRQRGVGQ